jgi:hypothetical protein
MMTHKRKLNYLRLLSNKIQVIFRSHNFSRLGIRSALFQREIYLPEIWGIEDVTYEQYVTTYERSLQFRFHSTEILFGRALR